MTIKIDNKDLNYTSSSWTSSAEKWFVTTSVPEMQATSNRNAWWWYCMHSQDYTITEQMVKTHYI